MVQILKSDWRNILLFNPLLKRQVPNPMRLCCEHSKQIYVVK